MLSAAQLEAAVARGVITAAQRDALLALPEAIETEATPDEQLRLVGGGNDLFVTIGALLFMAGGAFGLSAVVGAQSPFIAAAGLAASLALAEIITRQKRMRLSSTVLAVVFMLSAADLVTQGALHMLDLGDVSGNPLALAGKRGQFGSVSAGAALALLALAGAYFHRYRVPVLAAVAALILTALAFTQTALFLYDGVTSGTVMVPTADQWPDVLRQALYVPLGCGLAVFGAAVALDLHDRERRTIWSDCAFWLHVVSAPLLVHPLFIMATGQDVAFGAIEPGQDAVIGLTVLIALFTLVALAIDRRSLLVPTLAYFGSLGVHSMVSSAAQSAGIPPLALVLVTMGGLVILFGAGWQRIRRFVIGTVLPASVLRRLPPFGA